MVVLNFDGFRGFSPQTRFFQENPALPVCAHCRPVTSFHAQFQKDPKTSFRGKLGTDGRILLIATSNALITSSQKHNNNRGPHGLISHTCSGSSSCNPMRNCIHSLTKVVHFWCQRVIERKRELATTNQLLPSIEKKLDSSAITWSEHDTVQCSSSK